MRPFIVVAVLSLSAMVVSGQWVKQSVNTTASFRGLSVVNEKIVWASGTEGTVIRTIDGGKTWKVIQVPGAEKLDFRDIEAFDANTAYILSIGNGESSRIYKTTDGGKTWKEQFRNKDEKAFFDGIACWDSRHCRAVSDPVGGELLFISTWDGDRWQKNTFVKGTYTPKTKNGEAAFAASGTCIVSVNPSLFYVVTGGSAARVFRGHIGWTALETGFTSGTAGSGIFSIAMYDEHRGVIVGGDYEKPAEHIDNLAFTADSGLTWKLAAGLSGYRSGVAYEDRNTIIAVGTNGTDITLNGGRTWKKIGDENLNAVAAKGKRAVWAVGPKGMVVRMK